MKHIIGVILCLFLISNTSYAQREIFGVKIPTQSKTSSDKKTSNSESDILNTLGTILGGSSSGMTQSKAASGLKLALNNGTDFATNNLGVVDGFLKNSAVKILFPPEARKVESTMRKLGMGSLCDQFVNSINHAAEKAVVEAKPIFASAIREMTITDAIQILTGEENAATTYLKSTSGKSLNAAFEPIIRNELNKVNATKYWSQIIRNYNQLPFVKKVNPNLSEYVTEKASDGVFFMIAKEEKKIRENPLGQASQILQDVFGWAKNKK